MSIDDDDNTKNCSKGTSKAIDSLGSESIQIAPPATLSGILPDLIMHAPRRRGRPWAIYLFQLALTALMSSGFHMMFCHRVGAFFHRWRLRPLCVIVEKFIFHWYYCVIPCSARIGPGIWAPHPLGIVLNSRCRLGANCWLRQFTEIVDIPVDDTDQSGIVGDRVQLNSGAILLNGAIVAHDSIVAARALVTKFVPSGHVAKGSPAQISPMRPEQFLNKTPKWR